MFPNVRLMVAATLATVVVLVFGVGVFASFRLAHQLQSQLSRNAGPLQGFTDTPEHRLLAAVPSAPFDFRFALNEPPTINVPIETVALPHDAVQPPEPADAFPISAAVRKTDRALKEAIDRAWDELERSGRLAQVFARWHIPYERVTSGE